MHIFKLVIIGMPNKLNLYLWRCDAPLFQFCLGMTFYEEALTYVIYVMQSYLPVCMWWGNGD